MKELIAEIAEKTERLDYWIKRARAAEAERDALETEQHTRRSFVDLRDVEGMRDPLLERFYPSEYD